MNLKKDDKIPNAELFYISQNGTLNKIKALNYLIIKKQF